MRLSSTYFRFYLDGDYSLESMSSLRDALSSALESSEAGTLQSVADTPIEAVDVPHETAEAKAERVRDEAGRFAAKPAEVAQAAQPVTRNPPSSWKKEYWERWGKLEPETQGYIEQRDEESRRGVEAIKAQYEGLAPIQKALEPFMPTLQQRGITPDRWLQDLGHVDRVLSTGTLQEKTQLIHRMAAQNGIHLGVAQGQGDPQLQYALQNQQSLEQRMRAFENAQAQESNAQAQRQIDSFAADKPHFPKVKVEMGRLLQSGLATDLDTAYERAIWSDPEIRKELMAPQADAANRVAEIARKKAAASSPRSSSPTGALASGNGKKSLRDTLTEAVESVTSGRI